MKRRSGGEGSLTAVLGTAALVVCAIMLCQTGACWQFVPVLGAILTVMVFAAAMRKK